MVEQHGVDAGIISPRQQRLAHVRAHVRGERVQRLRTVQRDLGEVVGGIC
jgi:hypothetical protein